MGRVCTKSIFRKTRRAPIVIKLIEIQLAAQLMGEREWGEIKHAVTSRNAHHVIECLFQHHTSFMQIDKKGFGEEIPLDTTKIALA